MKEELGITNTRMTVYRLRKRYEIRNGRRTWKNPEGIVKAFYYPKGSTLPKGAYVDDLEEDAALVFC